MAAKISFKQMCPSCEAMVPVRDPKLIGRKIDCPKCKYRFVVEEPVDEEDEEEEEAPAKKKSGKDKITNKKPANGKAAPQRRSDDDEDEARPAKKSSGGGSAIMIVGIGLAAVAVLALAVGAWLLFGGEKDKPKPPGNGPVANKTSPDGGGGEVKEEKPKNEDKKEGPKPRVEDVTNLLPNDAQMVLNLPMKNLLGNAALQRASLRTPGAFLEADFQRTWGIPPVEVRRVVVGINAETKTVFSVMRTARPLNENEVVAGLKLKAETPIGTMNYYLVKKPLDGLSTFLLKMNTARDQVALHFFDKFTVVCADSAAMQQFLKAKGQPKHLTQSPSSEAEQKGGAKTGTTPGGPPGAPGAKPGGPPGAQPGAPGGPAGTPGAKPGASPPPPGKQPGAPPAASGGQAGAAPGAKPAAPPGAPGTPNAPGGPSGKPGSTGGYKPPNTPGAPGGMNPGTRTGGGGDSGPASASSSYLTVDPNLKAVLDQVEKVDKKEGQVVLISAAVNASTMDAEHLKKLAELLNKLAQQFDMPQVADFVLKEGKAAGFGLTELSDAKISATAAIGVKDEKQAQEWEKITTSWLPDLIARTGMDILSKEEIAKNEARRNSSPATGAGNPMFPGGFQPPPPGGKGPGGQQGRGGRPGNFPPGASPPGGYQPGAQSPNGVDEEKDEKKGKDGNYQIWTADSVLALGANVNIKAGPVTVSMVLSEGFKALRGWADVCDNRWRIHELAAATQAFVQNEGHFPRGTVPRAPSSERFVDWRPDQRLSWMVQLLPYCSNGAFSGLPIKNDLSWNESENLMAAATVIPQFLAPLPPDKPFSYYVQYPGLKGDPMAATHFVGMAGVGLDAAEYRADDPNKAKLRGIFGYDRETKPDEIKDGLDQTILLIQVPPKPQSPWLAGGGSTVRGVSSDSDCVQPFVCAEHDGKRGTFAIMADGKVRFIPATIDPKTFQAMCTIAGGEKIKDLDGAAPEVPPDEEPMQSELKAEPQPPQPSPEQAPSPKTPEGWTNYTSKEGGFSVNLPPGKVMKQDQQVDSPAGKLTVHLHGVELPEDAGTFVTTFNDYPAAVVAAGTDKIFEGVKIGAGAFGKGAKITNESTIKVEGNPGREWTVDIPGQGSMKWRVFLAKDRLYQLVAGGDPKKVPPKDIQAFFDSFKLTGK